MDEKHVNWEYEDGNAFFAHEISVNFTPLQVVFDIKNITPRIDARNRTGPVFKVQHNVIMMDPFHAKRFHALLSQVLQKYEEEFGKIKKPKAIEILEEKQKDNKVEKQHQSYFG